MLEVKFPTAIVNPSNICGSKSYEEVLKENYYHTTNAKRGCAIPNNLSSFSITRSQDNHQRAQHQNAFRDQLLLSLSAP